MTKAEFINLLLDRLNPWYPIRFVLVNDSIITFSIGATLAFACYDFDSERWNVECGNDDPSCIEFVRRCNAVLYGAVRDDEGNLIQS